jgi:hypothetical protein
MWRSGCDVRQSQVDGVNMSKSDTYAIVYYLTTKPSPSQKETCLEGQQMLVESDSDVLFLKIRDQTVDVTT